MFEFYYENIVRNKLEVRKERVDFEKKFSYFSTDSIDFMTGREKFWGIKARHAIPLSVGRSTGGMKGEGWKSGG